MLVFFLLKFKIRKFYNFKILKLKSRREEKNKKKKREREREIKWWFPLAFLLCMIKIIRVMISLMNAR